jgi:hypothetical protein
MEVRSPVKKRHDAPWFIAPPSHWPSLKKLYFVSEMSFEPARDIGVRHGLAGESGCALKTDRRRCGRRGLRMLASTSLAGAASSPHGKPCGRIN